MDELRQEKSDAEMESKEMRDENIRVRKDMDLLEMDVKRDRNGWERMIEELEEKLKLSQMQQWRKDLTI